MEHFDYLQRILHHLETSPERNAFYIDETWYTYGDLSSLIADIQFLITSSEGENDHVGVYLSDDIYTYASILALWMSGKAFVPLNPLFPHARNRNIMEQLDLRQLLHSRVIGEDQLSPECKALFTGELELRADRIPEIEEFSGEKDAYVLFTSGSTGNPKGVRISFNNLNAFVRDFIDYPAYSFEAEDRFLQMYDLSFDGSIPCYLVPLVVGASVYTVPAGGIKYLAAYKLMLEQRLTFVKMPPSTLSYLRPHFDSINLPEVKYSLFGGEAFPSLLAKEWETCVPNALIQNVYGPTEAAIISLIYDWNGTRSTKKEHQGTVSIGKAIGSNRIRVAVDDDREARQDQTGELLITGDQVSPGYWRDPVLNERAFVALEKEGKMCRYYRTGDMVSMDEEGDVMFIGRNDEQVQVMGYRVELGEIESLARDFLDGKSVMAEGKNQGYGEMMIYLTIESMEMDLDPLRNHLEKHLPPYMIPEKIITIAHFPRLVSGKLDRKAINDLLPL